MRLPPPRRSVPALGLVVLLVLLSAAPAGAAKRTLTVPVPEAAGNVTVAHVVLSVRGAGRRRGPLPRLVVRGRAGFAGVATVVGGVSRIKRTDRVVVSVVIVRRRNAGRPAPAQGSALVKIRFRKRAIRVRDVSEEIVANVLGRDGTPGYCDAIPRSFKGVAAKPLAGAPFARYATRATAKFGYLLGCRDAFGGRKAFVAVLRAAPAAGPQQPSAPPGPERVSQQLSAPVAVTECGTSPLPVDGPPEPFTAMWDRSGAGWTGGDGALSVPLPDGGIAWLMADTFIGGVADGRRVEPTMVTNSIVVQRGACMTTLFRRTITGAAVALVAPDDARTWYWPASGFVAGGELHVLYYVVVRGGPGQFNWSFSGTDMMSFSLPEVRAVRVRELAKDVAVRWGDAVVDDGGFTYVFGIETHGSSALHVARTPAGQLATAPWEYWNGSGWSSDRAASQAVLPDVGSVSFVVENGRWTLLSQGALLSDAITVRHAASPTGPWDAGTVVARAPAPAGGYTYGARLHPQLGGTDQALVSYSTNGWLWEDVLARPDLVRPRFIRVDLNQPG
jgi:Domain of unknown function (DUF4185)